MFAKLVLSLLGVSTLASESVDQVPITAKDIERVLQLPVETERRRGFATISRLMHDDPDAVAANMSKWVKPLMDAQAFELVDRAGLVAILHRPGATAMVSDVQGARVEALFALGRYQEAMIEAKRYYNVATMAKSTAAIDLIAEGLKRTRAAAEPGVVMRFRRQQLAGAEQSFDASAKADAAGLPPHYMPVAATSEGALGADVLRSIDAKDPVYEQALANHPERDDYQSLIARGNLLLLADRASEAKECFRRAAEMESTRGKDLVAAIEGVARAIRAEDGHVGRANAFVRALQSTEP